MSDDGDELDEEIDEPAGVEEWIADESEAELLGESEPTDD